ncbi:MAG: bile acid:sodium symporter family protein [Pelagibacteraceae bacterium]|nr:bile acid:sodium symporter family protein [Pelagibacteraceae bacterium]
MGYISEIFLPLAIAFIMFSLGLGLRIADFTRVILQPRDFFVGLSSQIIILPIIAFLLIKFFPSLPPELAVGVMLIAAVPGGATSNMFTSLAKGDVALSISLTAITSLICVVTIPLIAINSYYYFIGSSIEVSILQKSLELFSIVTVPTIIGMIIKSSFDSFATNFENKAKIISSLLLAIVIIGAIFKYKEDVLEYFEKAGLITLILNIVMMLLAFYIARIFASSIKQDKSITLECGLQNGTIAIFVADTIFNGGPFLIPAATYSLIMFATSIIFVFIIRNN